MAVTESFRKFRGRLRSALRSQYEAVAEIATPRKGSSKLRTPSCRPPERRAGMRMGAWRAKPVTRSSQRCRGPATGRGFGKAGAGKQTRITAGGGATARCARMRLCLILHQGASPLRPRPPFPGQQILWGERQFVKGTLRRQKAPPLTNCLSPRERNWEEGKGA